MKKEIRIVLTLLLGLSSVVSAQETTSKRSWKQVANTSDRSWYASTEAKEIAENVLWYQRKEGGWPKNMPLHLPIGNEVREKGNAEHKSFAPTLDNDATTTEMRFMARMYKATGDKRYEESFLKGLNYLLEAQYESGGWPQFYPLVKGYYTHITYNDNAMVNILKMEEDIFNRESDYDFVSSKLRQQVEQSFDKGIDCILKTQIVKNGERTVWCAQHDEKSYLPTIARAYELPSFSGSESASIVQLLMSLPHPSNEVIQAVDAAVKWFETHRLIGIRQDYETDADGKRNRIIVDDPNAPALWARFYDLDTEKPYFCDRDGVKREKLSEIGAERRNGYSWYGTWGQKILNAYPKWKAKTKRATLYTIGDSTMAEKDTTKGNPERGWGMAFRTLVDDKKMDVVNLAKNGRSSKTFRNEGLWDKAYNNLKEGDYVFIQFGHNDSKKEKPKQYADPRGEFKENIVRYIRETKSKGATPIVFTSIARRHFENGKITLSHGDYVTVIPEIAREEGVLMIDLFALTKALFESKGEEESKAFFKYLDPNVNPNFPEGFKDNTHLNERGALAVAERVVAELKKSDSTLKNMLK